jgi:hypothetical protein
MDSLPRPRRHAAARILSAIVIVPMLLAACSGGTGGAGAAAGGDPAAVVKDALAKTAAKDVEGLGALACAGQVDKLKEDLDMSNAFGGAIPGVDTAALADSVTIDTSGVTVGAPAVTGDTATVPVSGTMKMTFDKEKIRPIVKQVMEAQGGGITMTDAQIDQFLDAFAGQGIPINETMTLKQENGAWKICEPSSGSDGAAPSAGASAGY